MQARNFKYSWTFAKLDCQWQNIHNSLNFQYLYVKVSFKFVEVGLGIPVLLASILLGKGFLWSYVNLSNLLELVTDFFDSSQHLIEPFGLPF